MTSHGMYWDAKERRCCICFGIGISNQNRTEQQAHSSICIGIGISISNHNRIEQQAHSRRQYHDSLGFVAQGLGSRHILRLGDAGPGAAQELPDHVQGQGHQASPTEHHEQQPPYSHIHTPVLWHHVNSDVDSVAPKYVIFVLVDVSS